MRVDEITDCTLVLFNAFSTKKFSRSPRNYEEDTLEFVGNLEK